MSTSISVLRSLPAAAVDLPARRQEVFRPGTGEAGSRGATSAAGANQGGATSANASVDSGLSVEDLRQIDALRVIDRQVRAHELAHMAAGAGLTGGASFTYRVGPDNQRYAVGGEVSIAISHAGSAEETIARAQQIRSAALAPADPSPQDRKVAALASRMADAARQELAAEQAAEKAASAQGAGRRESGAVAAIYQAVAAGPSASAFDAVA
ncbi:MAG: hypothetical protein IAE88_00655 [Rhodobacteraceae bacterium]|nr:hypothetical protein [Paracoccaceae bacterium]MCB1942522.1 hypothetical protein [Accumulibacter sp.]